MIPNADAATAEWFRRRGRAGLSPAAARDLILMNSQADVRAALQSVQCPTLVMHRTGDRDSRVDEGRYIAERIMGARFVELTGDDHVPFVSDGFLARVWRPLPARATCSSRRRHATWWRGPGCASRIVGSSS